MTRRTMIAGLLWTVLATAFVHAVEPGQADDGFVPMFDGKTLDGWVTTGNLIVE